MMKTVAFILFMAVVIAWNVAAFYLFRALRERHAAVYESMGSPTVFSNTGSVWRFLRFVLSGEWRDLADASVARLCRVMRVVFWVTFVSLVAVFIEAYSDHWSS